MIKHILDEEYFAIDAVSNSLLSRLAKCPAAMNQQLEQTPAMLLGSVAHCLILEGREAFESRYAVAPECDKRTKEGKALWQSFCQANPDQTIITQDQLEAVVGMATSVASHPACQDLLKNGTPEMAVTWEEGDISCKAKCDWISNDCLIDLKTCTDSSYPIFSKTIFNSRYAQQFGFYRRGLRANMVHPEHCVIIAVESRFPFTTNVYELSEEVVEYGEGQSLELLETYRRVKDMNSLPAYTWQGIHDVQLPVWLKETE